MAVVVGFVSPLLTLSYMMWLVDTENLDDNGDGPDEDDDDEVADDDDDVFLCVLIKMAGCLQTGPPASTTS